MDSLKEEEIIQHKSIIFANVIVPIGSICRLYQEKNNKYIPKIEKVFSLIKKEMEALIKITEDESHLLLNGYFIYTKYLHEDIRKVWKNKIFFEFFQKFKYEKHLSDGSEYLINLILKLNKSEIQSYTPSNTDILMSRKKTIGITEFETNFENTNINFFDVGGQRSERKVYFIFIIKVYLININIRNGYQF
jgi:hypothetical protein